MRKRIVVVEDEADVAKMIKFVLEKKGFEVFIASDGLKGYESVRDNLPDLILLDLCLPGLNGIELSQKLNQEQKLKSIPILLLTASADNINKKAQESRASDFLLKPFDYLELIKKVKSLVGDN
ncbi:MAG: response regulator [Candidatus Omnitrophica bacterium]|nr:response regulator [Candidatus Omnitrophota bacterium]